MTDLISATTLLADTAKPAYSYQPFVTPLPMWNTWEFLIIPLCIAVALVYKSAKCRALKDIPREAGLIAVWILAAMIGAAVLLNAVTWAVQPR